MLIGGKCGQRMGTFQQNNGDLPTKQWGPSNKTMLFQISFPYCREKHFNIVSDEICALKCQGYTSCFMNLICILPCIMTQYTKMTNKMQLCRIIYYPLAVLHVSSDIFPHHQEHLNCITASVITYVCRCQLAATYVCNTRSCNTV